MHVKSFIVKNFCFTAIRKKYFCDEKTMTAVKKLIKKPKKCRAPSHRLPVVSHTIDNSIVIQPNPFSYT